MLPDQAAFDELIASPCARELVIPLTDYHILGKTQALGSGWAICRLQVKR
jgi:hypothetical protein